MARRRKSLNGKWSYVLDQYKVGEQRKFMAPVGKNSEVPGRLPVDHNMEDVDTITVPSSWNVAVPELKYYEHNLWYYKKFQKTESMKSGRSFLCFEASYYKTKVWLNGKKLGEHLGGFTPFEFDITDVLEKNNVLAVMVDATRLPDRAPTVTTDWFTYGGIYRDVYIENRPSKRLTDFFVYLDKSGKRIRGRISASHAGTAEIRIPEMKIIEQVKISGKTHSGSFAVPAPASLERWDTSNPKLYNVTASFENDTVKDKVGFRTIEVKEDNILLNGRPVYLKGVSVHEDHITRGRSLTDQDREDVFRHAKQLGCNFLRLAHYPHSRRMAQMADERGILLWEEVPVYWRIQWQNRDTYNDASNQLKGLILRDRNRASVILWSIANETPANAPGRTKFLSQLSHIARRLDPSRLRTAAMFIANKNGEFHVDDPLADEIDVIGINEYLGWYGPSDPKEPSKMKKFMDPGKPVIVSEFGAGARAGYHGSERFTEEYQQRIYEEQLKALKTRKSIKGLTPWILIDFRAPRYNKYQRGFNVKGLVDSDRNTRKKAFKVYADFQPPTQKS